MRASATITLVIGRWVRPLGANSAPALRWSLSPSQATISPICNNICTFHLKGSICCTFRKTPGQIVLNLFYSQGGGGEDLFSTEKSKEQLYIEAKHVLNSVEPYTTTKRPQDLNGVSPPQTVPRKPPRSKHDPCSNVIRPPSQEAAQRVLIGKSKF